MRGVFSFLFLAAVLFAVLALQPSRGEDLSRPWLVEKVHYLDLDFKNALRQALDARDAEEAASRLVSLEGFFERKAAGQGVSADLWVGFVSEGDVAELKASMLAEKKALKCGNCFDFSLPFEGIAVVNAFLGFGEKLVVSSSGLSLFSKAADSFFRPFGKKPFFGASLYSDGLAYVALAGEGFS